jgi:hypothetical protein
MEATGKQPGILKGIDVPYSTDKLLTADDDEGEEKFVGDARSMLRE